MSKRIDAHMHVCQWYTAGDIPFFDTLRRYQREHQIEAVDMMCCSSQGDLWRGYGCVLPPNAYHPSVSP